MMNLEDYENWVEDGHRNGWSMPAAPRWKRLPVIRRFRAAYHGYQISRHEALWRSLGSIPSGYDKWVVFGIAHGLENRQ